MRITAAVIGALLVGSAPAAAQTGQALFEGKGACFACHGKDAKGTALGPNLTDAEWLHGDPSLANLALLITNGVPRPKRHPAPMPPRGGGQLTPAEVDSLAAYVVRLRAAADTTAARPRTSRRR